MPDIQLMFNSLLSQIGIAPEAVILLRHQDTRSDTKRTPFLLWRDDRPAFHFYQSIQTIKNRPRFRGAKYWASFVARPDGATMFVGLYATQYKGTNSKDRSMPHRQGMDRAGTVDEYKLNPDKGLSHLAGRLFIEWGNGRTWIQRAENQNKPIVELHREIKDPVFPGYLNFNTPLSRLDAMPTSWVEVLKQGRGVYLFTCPRTKEQYVGSASGEEGFWQRWKSYFANGHGGNKVLISRDPSDYEISILEVAGSAATREDIHGMESKWKKKLRTREMGLHGN